MRSSLKHSDIKAFIQEYKAYRGSFSLFFLSDPANIATLRTFNEQLPDSKVDRELSTLELFDLAKKIVTNDKFEPDSMAAKFHSKITSRLPMELVHSTSLQRFVQSNLLSLPTVERLIRQHPKNAKKIADGLLDILVTMQINQVKNESFHLVLKDILQDEINDCANVEHLCKALHSLHNLNILTQENRALLTANLNQTKNISKCLEFLTQYNQRNPELINPLSAEHQNIIFRSIILLNQQKAMKAEYCEDFVSALFKFFNKNAKDKPIRQQANNTTVLKLVSEIIAKQPDCAAADCLIEFTHRGFFDVYSPSRFLQVLSIINTYATTHSLIYLEAVTRHIPTLNIEKLELFTSNPDALESIFQILYYGLPSPTQLQNENLNAVYQQLYNRADRVKELAQKISAEKNLNPTKFREIIHPYQLQVDSALLIYQVTNLPPVLTAIVKSYLKILEMLDIPRANQTKSSCTIKEITPSDANTSAQQSASTLLNSSNLDMKENYRANATSYVPRSLNLGLFNNVVPIQLNDAAPTDAKEAAAVINAPAP